MTGRPVSTAADGAGSGDAGSITLTGTIYDTNALTLNARAATNTIRLSGGAGRTTIRTSADMVTVTGKVDLGAADLTVDTTDATGSPTGANITFNQTIERWGAGARKAAPMVM